MKSDFKGEVPLFKAGSEGTQKKWLIKGIATIAMLGGIAAASNASGVSDKVDDMFEAAVHMALEPASAATVANTTIDKATAVPSRSTTSTGKETADYIVKGSASYQSSNSNNDYSWYSLSNGKQQTGLVVYNTALDTKNDFTASGSFYVANYGANAADYNGILLSSILPDTLGSGTGGGGLGIQGIKNAISFGMDMYSNVNDYKDASGTYPMVGIRTTDSSGNLTQATVDSSLTSGSGVSSLPASSKPDGINSGTGAAWSVKYTASTKTLTFSLGGKVTKSMTINTTTMPYLSFALIGSAGDNTTEMTSSIQSVSGTKASMTVPVTYKDTAGNTLLTSTKLDVGDGQSVGINGASPKASSDTFSYDAPAVPGYYIKSANDISVKVGSGTTPSLNLVYEKSPQQATVTRTGLNASNAVKNGTTVAASGVTSGAIAIADASLAVASYSYVVTAPDGKQYSTMSEALAAGTNGVYDSTTNSSGASDAAVQSFGVSYSALSQKANFSYSGGTPLSGAPTVASGVTDGSLPGSLFVYAPSGYRLDSVSTTLASGIGVTYATTMRSATITGTFDADTATDQNSTIVLKADKQTATLKQVVNAKTSDVESVTGGTDSKIAFGATDATLAKTGYTYNVTGADGKTYDTLSAALAATPNYDNTSNDGDTDAKAQVFTVNYTDTQAPTISTGKDSYQVTTGAGTTADSFLSAINAQVTDNQMDGTTTLTSNYADVVKDEPGTYTVTLTATDATGLKTTKTITVVVTETSPYDQELAVSSAASNLETISNDPTKTTADVQTAQKALDDAIAAAKSDRETAKTNAETAEKNATEQGVADDSTVMAAQKALDDAIAAADNNTGTTQAIVDATNALDRAVAVASAKAVATNPVSQETAVESAKDNLDKVLANSASTTEQIIAARDALKDAVNDALEARNNALTGADTAINNAASSTAALDPDVIAAQKALQDAVASANADTGTTDAVTKATEALNKAVADAEEGQEAARAAAAAAIAAMTPVSNEANILAAYKSLQDILDNQNATADEITNATTALANATETEKDTREDAVSAANTAITNAQTGDNANDEGVKEAIENLQNVIANATAETAAADGKVPLTDDIEAATQALAQAISDAASAREDAVTAAQDMMNDTAPVSLEPDTATAKDALQKVLDDPKATATDIEEAMQDFKDAMDIVRDERTAIDGEATSAITTAQNSDYADEKGVQDAIAALKEAQENAANDTGTTADITNAMKSLQDALDAAKSEQQKAIDDAEAVATSPVSHEADVVDAQKALDDLIASAESGGDVSIADINDAAQALQDAVDAASDARDDANDAADQAVTDAEATNQADEQSVQDAIQALRDLQDAASQDDENALTADIEAATKAIADAVEKAAADQVAARDAAGKVETAPVSNEQGVKDTQQALNDVLNDPASTVAEIEAAQQALEDAVKTAQDNRDAANKTADSVMANAQSGDQAGEPGVQDAITALQELQNKAATDDAGALTADIEAATKAVTQAIADAKAAQDAARDAAGQVETAPVSNEAGVKDAQSALDKVLNDSSATVEEIEDATTALENAVDAANEARNSANTNADTAISQAQGTPQINEPSVQEAVEKLQELQQNAANDSASALTQDILDAIQELSDTVAEAARDKQEAVLAAENALSQTKPVSNESATAQAIAELQALLADDNSTAEAVRDATKALTAATASDTTERNATNTDAADAISAAQASTVATDESVLTAIQNLKDAQTKAANETVDDAGHAWVSQDIVDAMRALQEAVSVAEQAQDTARDEASASIQDDSKTSPVTNEPSITDAKSALQDVINDPNATAADLNDAMAAYQDVIDQTKTQRDNAKDTATDAITAAQNSDLSADQGVQDAITALQDVMNQADADSADALTSDIQDAMKALQDAQIAAVESRNQAAELADQVKGQTAPVSQEPGVQQAVSDLDTLLNDSTATADQINNAIKSLQDAVAEANDERDTVNQAANDAATAATNSDQSQSQAVQDAIAALQEAQKNAADDQGTSEAIATATKQLQDAVAQEAADQATERDNAAAAMDATAPVSNETAVATAKNALEAVLGDPKSTADEIADAVKALTDATTSEKANRDTANTAANDAITNVPAEVANEPQVAEAVDNLQRLMDEAANDSSGALTKDIAAATEALAKAQNDVVGYREQARDAAADALTQTALVSHEPATAAAIDALNALINDPNANYADIKQATEDLLKQVATDTQERDATSAAGNALLDQAAQSDLANDPSVVEAMHTLRDAIANAATDSSDDLTADIKAAMQALTDAMTSLVDDAREQAQQAIADAKPVSNEKGVADAIKKLQTLINDPNATRTAIEAAMDALKNAVEPAKESRESANNQAEQALQAAQNSAVSDDPAVQAAMQRLQDILAAAATDNPDNLTADILAAMQALQSAVAKAEAAQATTSAVTAQAPVPTAGGLTDSSVPAAVVSSATGEAPATQMLYGTAPIYQNGGYPIVVPGVLPYTGYEVGSSWISGETPVMSQVLPYQATAPRTLAGDTEGRRIFDQIRHLDGQRVSRAGLDTAIAHENRWLPIGIFLFSSILLLLIAKRRKQDDK
ncbi:lectin-like domain-containing protein [Weissella sp. LMG 11983]|uniref:lectin-like domain-containing protein n=1 Tax=Weissella sp. LMG 11983 TaxID=2987700 RepID=UPI0021F8D9F8|nr:hypothetical protein [Weissella sp. LMG 11983]MCW0926099.1 hypothetical protein [Weissella sp. LMG 11983]